MALQFQLAVVDFGTAEFYHPGTAYNVRLGGRYIKQPELLLNYQVHRCTTLNLLIFGDCKSWNIFFENDSEVRPR